MTRTTKSSSAAVTPARVRTAGSRPATIRRSSATTTSLGLSATLISHPDCTAWGEAEPEQRHDRERERGDGAVGAEGEERRQARLDDADRQAGGHGRHQGLEAADQGRREGGDDEE